MNGGDEIVCARFCVNVWSCVYICVMYVAMLGKYQRKWAETQCYIHFNNKKNLRKIKLVCIN